MKDIVLCGRWNKREYHLDNSDMLFFQHLAAQSSSYRYHFINMDLPQGLFGVQDRTKVLSHVNDGHYLVFCGHNFHHPRLPSFIRDYSRKAAFMYDTLNSPVYVNYLRNHNFKFCFHLAEGSQIGSRWYTIRKMRELAPDIKFFRGTSFIDQGVFYPQDLEKKHDVFGAMIHWPDYEIRYPFRHRVYSILHEAKEVDFHYIQENEDDFYKPETREKIYAELGRGSFAKNINESLMTFVSPSIFDFFVKKYTEVALCKTLMIGRLPEHDPLAKKYHGCVFELDKHDPKEDIINAVLHLKEDRALREELTDKAYDVAINNFTWRQGVPFWENAFQEFIDYTKKA